MPIEIPLTKGETAIVSEEDKDLAQWSWRLCDSNRRRHGGHYAGYAKCWVSHAHAEASPYRQGQTKRLHRVILERIEGRVLERWEHTDHINGNGLDNRRENVRLATPSQNSCNTRKPKAREGSSYGKISKYKGVSRTKKRNGDFMSTWYCYIRVNGKVHYRSGFKTEEDAVWARDVLALKLHGEYAYLNFPERLEEYMADLKNTRKKILEP